jgi:hypothetical protein
MMTREELVRPATLMIKRAEHHINDLSTQIGTYLAQKPFRLIASYDQEAGKVSTFIKQKAPIPDAISLVLGDAIHNLRSALDLIVFGMIGDKVKNPEPIQFPFAKHRDTFARTLEVRKIKLAGEKVVRAIEALEPYPGGNKWLSALHALDITDKHRLIVPVATAGEIHWRDFATMFPQVVPKDLDTPEGAEALNKSGVILEMGTTIVFHVPRPSRAERRANRGKFPVREYEHDIQPTFQICFAKGQPFELCLIDAILVDMASEISEAVERIADAYFEI